MKLRDYQNRSVDRVRSACQRGQRTILVLPTGGGKTKTAVHGIVKPAIAAGFPVLWLAHRVELIGQADSDLLSAGVRTGIVKSSVKPDPSALCQVASIQTLARRKTLPPARIVITDECHHVRSATYSSVLAHYQEQRAIVIGLTATPARLDGKGLGDVFDHIVEETTTRELIDSGNLADFDYYAPNVPDLGDVKTVAGEFNAGGAGAVMNRPTITGNLVRHYRHHLGGKRALVFANSILHSQIIVGAFTDVGIPTAHLDGSTPDHERRETLARFAAGEILVVSNVNLFDEGFDVPACQGVIIARPTQSFVKHRQMIGRCLRPKPDGSRAIVLDHAGNFERHGMPDDVREWDLADVPKAPTEACGYKQCPSCFAVVASHSRTCDACGAEFVSKPRSGPDQVDGELEQVKRKPLTVIEKRELYRALMAQARTLGNKPGWAKRQYQIKAKVWPKGFVEDVDQESFRLCAHERVERDLCRHCGEYQK